MAGASLEFTQPDELWAIPSLSPAMEVPVERDMLTIKDLYADAPGRPQILLKAQAILVAGLERMAAARDYIVGEELLNADYEVTLFQGDLPELFYFSASVEGFSTVVVAIHDALKNRQGKPLDLDQINAIRRCLTALTDRPFMKYDDALDLVDLLETTGLCVNPPESSAVAEILLEDEEVEERGS